MINKLYIPFIIIILFVFQSCDDEWIFDIPGCMDQSATNYDFNATSDNGSCCYGDECTIVDINASSYDEWVYFSLESGEIISISNPENSMNWDNIKTNGGLSGIGDGCAIVDNSQPWNNESFESTNQISEGECQIDDIVEGNIITYEGCYNPNTHFFSDCIKNPALDNWGSFDSSYHFNINNYRFFVKRADGVYVKFWLMGYYNNGTGGHISMAYQTIY